MIYLIEDKSVPEFKRQKGNGKRKPEKGNRKKAAGCKHQAGCPNTL